LTFFFDSNHPPPQAIKSPEAVVQAAHSELVLTNAIALKSEAEEQLSTSPIANPVANANVSDSSTTDIIDSAVRQLAICDRILSVAQAHQMTCAYTKLRREHLLEANATSKKQLQLSIAAPHAAGHVSQDPAAEMGNLMIGYWKLMETNTKADWHYSIV
jgi:hypothetical protein